MIPRRVRNFFQTASQPSASTLRLKGMQRQPYLQVLGTTVAVSTALIGLRLLGGLQLLEWLAYDRWVRLRPIAPIDSRITLVTINELDLRTAGSWPIPDQAMAELLIRLKTYQPRVIGLDIYRDLPVEPGHNRLQEVFATTSNLYGIEQIKDQYNLGVPPPSILKQQGRVGFNNLVFDQDGRVRRSLLFWTAEETPPALQAAASPQSEPLPPAAPSQFSPTRKLKTHTSFPLQLAIAYLQPQGTSPQTAPGSSDLQLGQARFERLQANEGGYVNVDNGGYQILAQLRGPTGRFQRVSMQSVLDKQVEPELLRDRIVIIGSTATSLKDFFYTAYSAETGSHSGPAQMAGIELQANMVSQILQAALGEQTLMRSWPEWAECLWIVLWAWFAAQISWWLKSPLPTFGLIGIAGVGVGALSYGAFLSSWWIPVVPALLGMAGSATVVTANLVRTELQLKRSKEFFGALVNAIPDPVFVKDQNHCWIVVNPAYCKLLGCNAQDLLERDAEGLFPPQEVEALRWHETQVFATEQDQEIEEVLTDRQGRVRLLATKRSLHRDSAGNRYLVGVIRDITDRKRSEDELKQTAAELVRSNAELQLSANRLQYLANHDTLTGLPNRKLFYERLEQSLMVASNSQQAVGLMFLDLDGFKAVNDTHGHDVGDLLLQAVAQRLTSCLRGSDIVARLAGDEFTVILPTMPPTFGPSPLGMDEEDTPTPWDMTRSHMAMVAEKILARLGRSFVLNQHEVRVTTSIGISIFPFDGLSQDALIKGADTAMYEAKQQGKNQFRFIAVQPSLSQWPQHAPVETRFDPPSELAADVDTLGRQQVEGERTSQGLETAVSDGAPVLDGVSYPPRGS